jgi:hypothetical protein
MPIVYTTLVDGQVMRGHGTIEDCTVCYNYYKRLQAMKNLCLAKGCPLELVNSKLITDICEVYEITNEQIASEINNVKNVVLQQIEI